MFIRDVIIPALVTGLVAFATALLESIIKMFTPRTFPQSNQPLSPANNHALKICHQHNNGMPVKDMPQGCFGILAGLCSIA
jgi:hypothetical protein